MSVCLCRVGLRVIEAGFGFGSGDMVNTTKKLSGDRRRREWSEQVKGGEVNHN